MIYGRFVSKRGTAWNYTIYDNGYVEQWHENIVRCTGGWKQGRTTFVEPTKECKEHIKNKYGIEV